MNGETEPLALSKGAAGTLSLSIGSGEARRLIAVNRVLSVGSARDNDIVITDRAVSAHHCRFQPNEEGVLVQDLSSRNGTWVDGVRVVIGRVRDEAHIRIGRTELLLSSARMVPVDPDGLLAASNAMARVLMDVERFAKLSWPVLVLGESGVGKEGVARALHQKSERSHKPFVAINAGGINRELVESELFGHEKGSFTGAMQMHRGVFEQADGGTLFLDEIGELPLEMQSRLLRVLETWEVRRVGALSSVCVDVRLVCATHRDVRVMSADKSFRWDLYYRLARLVVEIPPLRTRPDDIRVLARHFSRLIEREVGPRVLTDDALARLVE